MANLTSSQIKDSYQSVLTTSETTSDPTTGTLQNGKGSAITALTVSGALTLTGDLTVDTSTLKVDSANNRVGVKTASPSYPLDVHDVQRIVKIGAGYETGMLLFETPTESGAQYRLGMSTGASFTIGREDTDATFLTLTSAGNVGIGTTSPNVGGFSKALTISSAESAVELSSASNVVQGTLSSNANGLGVSGVGALGIRFSTSASGDASERMRITSDGFARLASGSGGIQFNGDTASANALDDYEEGTFDFSMAFNGSSTGVTYVARAGKYTKIGNKVTVTGVIELSSKGAQSGIAQITGLPFTVFNASSNFAGASLSLQNITFTGQYSGYAQINTDRVTFAQTSEAGVFATLDNTNFANNSIIIICLTYFTS